MQRNTNKLNNVNTHKNFPFVLNVNCLQYLDFVFY